MGDKSNVSIARRSSTSKTGLVYSVPWKKCAVCESTVLSFKSPREFCRHLREFHCSKEGGSFVCKYGSNGVCPSLPIEGVSDRDYEDHVARDHVAGDGMARRASSYEKKSQSEEETIPSPSTEPSVVQDQYKWNVYMSKVNLPAALNDPRLTRRETDFFTKTWGESFEKTDIAPSAHLPCITKEHFKKYLKQTSKRFKDHISHVYTSDNAQIDSLHFATGSVRKHDKQQIEFEQVPKLFLHPGFSLENPDTFNAVFPWSQVENQQGHSAVKQSSKLLQEKLSHYLDVVEVQIAKQISHRSEAFFHAMTSHDKLQENMSTTCASIRKLRDRVHHMSQVMTEAPLKIIKLQKMRSNYVTLHNKLKLMATVHQTQPTIQLLLATNEFVGALDLISTTQEVLAQELQGLVCFRHLGSQLSELEKLIDKMMQEDFARYANMDLNRPISEGYSVLQEERFVAIILGVIRQHKYNFIDMYREEAAMSLKAVLKQTVIEAVTTVDPADLDANTQSLADKMRQLNYIQWMDLLQQVFNNFKVILMRVKSITEIMQEVLLLASGGRPSSPQQTDTVFTEQCVGEEMSLSLGGEPSSQSKHLPSVGGEEPSMSSSPQQTHISSQHPVISNGTNKLSSTPDSELVNSSTSPSQNNASIKSTAVATVTGQKHCSRSSPVSILRESKAESRRNSSKEQGTPESGNSAVDNSQNESTRAPPVAVSSRVSISTEVDVMISQSECSKALASVREMLCLVCDHAHSRCEKLLVARAKDGFLERLNSVEFVTLSRAVEGFVGDCEEICGRRSTALRSCLQSQANKFVCRFHDERKTKLSLILDNERWKQADVPAEFQDLVDNIETTGSLSLPVKAGDSVRSPGEFLYIGREKYAVVGTVLLLLKMLVEYCECVEDIPSACPDILTRLIEQLKMFNSRTCQLILGAGALQLVGLKTITTKNLALASRCLQLVVYYVPIVQRHFESKLHGKQVNMLKHFQHVLKDYNDHIAELSNKLVAIMDSVFDSLLPKWEVRPPMPSLCFRNLCKQITKLHEAVAEILTQPQVTDIFERLHSSFKVHLRSQLIKLGVTNDGGPQHGLVMSDIAFYQGSLKALQGIEHSLYANMEEIWDKG